MSLNKCKRGPGEKWDPSESLQTSFGHLSRRGSLTQGNDIRVSPGMTVRWRSAPCASPLCCHAIVAQIFGRPLTKKVMSHSPDGPGVTAPLRTNIIPLTAVWNPPPPPSVTPPQKIPEFSSKFGQERIWISHHFDFFKNSGTKSGSLPAPELQQKPHSQNKSNGYRRRTSSIFGLFTGLSAIPYTMCPRKSSPEFRVLEKAEFPRKIVGNLENTSSEESPLQFQDIGHQKKQTCPQQCVCCMTVGI